MSKRRKLNNSRGSDSYTRVLDAELRRIETSAKPHKSMATKILKHHRKGKHRYKKLSLL